MPLDRIEAGSCSKCSEGKVLCKHNFFEESDKSLTIHSWEHRCRECGYRETEAIRSDEELPEGIEDPSSCPFCGRRSADTI